MRLRLTVTQFRISLLVVNLLLSAGVLAFAGYSYYGLTNRVDDLKLVDPRSFEPGRDDAVLKPQPSPQLLQGVADQLMPPPLPALPTNPEPDVKTPESSTTTAVQPGELPTGPLLEKGWRYVGYILWPDPRYNQVFLKKEAETGGSPLARGTPKTGPRQPRTVIRPTQTPPRGQPGMKLGARNMDRISFTIRDRVFIDKELDLDFMIESADDKRFVYWERSNPGKLYALPYVLPGTYLGSPQEGLRPPPPAEETAAEAGAEAEKKHLIQIIPDDFRDRKEEEYDAMKKGAPPGPAFQASMPKEEPKDAQKAAPASGGPQAPITSPGMTRLTPPGVPKPLTEQDKKEMRRLTEIMKSPKLKPEDRKKFEDAMKGFTK